MAFTVYDGSNDTTLVDALLAPNSGITLIPDSVVLSASGADAVNFYDGSQTALGIESGLLLTSGTTPGLANTVGWFGADNSTWPDTFYNGDADIDAVVNSVFATQSYDATTLSFSFTADPSATSVSFDIVFGTDEFPEWVDQFVDCAVVMVNGVNYALFNHDPLHPLSVISSNLAAGYFQDNAGNVLPIEYDGVSHVLKIVAPIHPGEINHIKIGIADTGDHIYDSGIFIANLTAGNIPGSGTVITGSDGCTDSSDTVSGSSKDEYFDLKGGDDVCYAGAGDDIIVSGAGNDAVYGGSGADQLKGDGGDDFLDGGADSDTAVFAGNSVSYTLAYDSTTNSFTVSDTSLVEGADTLTNVELAQFADGLFTLTADGLVPVTNPGTPPSNTPGTLVVSGIGAVGNTLTATVSDADGISGPVGYQWQLSSDGSTWTDIAGATGNAYTVAASDVGMEIQALATYVDDGMQGEALVSAPKAILSTGGGDLVVTLMQLSAPAGATVINPLTTLVQAAVDLGLTPNMAALAVKTVLGLPAGIGLQTYDAYASLLLDPTDATALQVEKVAVQVAILTSLSDDDTGTNLALKILDAAAEGRTLDLANLDDLSVILGLPAEVDPATGKYPQPLDEILDRNKSMSDALADGGGMNAIEQEWQDLLSIQDGIDSTSIADLSIHVNQAPAGSSTATLIDGAQGTPYVVSADDLVQGFYDPEGGTLGVGTLSADVGAVTDNGDGTFSILLGPDYTGPVELTYTVIDPLGAAASASQLFVVAAPPVFVDHEAAGTLVVSGAAEEGGSLGASLADLVDVDGGVVATAFRWQESVAGTWTDITGADGETLAIPSDQSFVGKEVRVVATTTDAAGGTTELAGASQTIANVDDEASGTLSIDGSAVLGSNLTAALTNVSDSDGALVSIAYQWQENLAGTWTDIAGATSETYLVPSDAGYVGKEVRAVATTTDTLGGTSSFATAGQTLTAPPGKTLVGTGGADTLSGTVGDDTLSGLGGTDSLNGLAGNDVLNGGSGNDTLRGGSGDDWLEGGAGADTLYGDDGVDTASWASSGKAISANLLTGKCSGGDAQGDVLSGIENLAGSALNDTLVGNAAANVLSGGDGADILRGLGGQDQLRGGAGADKFDFDALADSGIGTADLILDFVLGSDKIDLSTLDANASANKNQAFNANLLDGLDQVFTAAGQLRFGYSIESNTTIVEGNVDADAAPEFEIHLVGNVPLTADAFVL